MKSFSVVLYHPEIPQNTGTIGRTCLALNFRLILIKPYAFSLSEKAVRRAGLDYWKHVDLIEYDSFDDFLNKEDVKKNDLLFFSTKATKLFYDAPYNNSKYLVFGAETKGLPKELFERFDSFYTLPIKNRLVRSLNLSNCVTAVCYQAIKGMD